jgi:hypothetical protein
MGHGRRRREGLESFLATVVSVCHTIEGVVKAKSNIDEIEDFLEC